MTTTPASAALVPAAPVFSEPARLALAGFLAGYSGLTRDASALDLRQFAAWCARHQKQLFGVRGVDIECFRPRPRGRRAGPGDGDPPAVHDRRVLQVRGRGGTARPFPGRARPPAAAGLRVPCQRPGPQPGRRAPGRRRARHRGRARPDLAARPERATGLRGHRRRHRSARHRARSLAITPEAGKKAVIPLAPRTARAIDLAVGERCEGPIFTTPAGQRLDRHGAGRIVRRVARRAGLAKKIGPNTLRHAFITAALDTGVPLRDVQEAASHADPRTTIRYDRARVSLDRHATYILAAYIAGPARQPHPEHARPGSVLAARRPGDCSSPVARSRSATTGSDTSHDEGSLGAARSSRRGPA